VFFLYGMGPILYPTCTSILLIKRQAPVVSRCRWHSG